MPTAVSEAMSDWKTYEEETGGTDDTPVGNFQAFIMQGDNHPRAAYNEKTGLPEIFAVLKIDPDVDQPSKGRTITANLRWFSPEENSQGEAFDEDKIKMIEGINRKEFRTFMQAVFGKQLEDYEYAVLPAGGDSLEEVLEVFKAVASELPNKRLTVKSTPNKKNPQYVNLSFAAPKDLDF